MLLYSVLLIRIIEVSNMYLVYQQKLLEEVTNIFNCCYINS